VTPDRATVEQRRPSRVSTHQVATTPFNNWAKNVRDLTDGRKPNAAAITAPLPRSLSRLARLPEKLADVSSSKSVSQMATVGIG